MRAETPQATGCAESTAAVLSDLLDLPASVAPDLTHARAAGLADAELERWRRLRSPSARADSLAAHALVRARAIDVCAHPPRGGWRALRIDYRCPSCSSTAHGRPMLRGRGMPEVSLSHARGHVAVAVGARRVGIDVEMVDAVSEVDPAGFLTVPEQDALAGHPRGALLAAWAWCAKEAAVKLGRTELDRASQFDTRWAWPHGGRAPESTLGQSAATGPDGLCAAAAVDDEAIMVMMTVA